MADICRRCKCPITGTGQCACSLVREFLSEGMTPPRQKEIRVAAYCRDCKGRTDGRTLKGEFVCICGNHWEWTCPVCGTFRTTMQGIKEMHEMFCMPPEGRQQQMPPLPGLTTVNGGHPLPSLPLAEALAQIDARIDALTERKPKKPRPPCDWCKEPMPHKPSQCEGFILVKLRSMPPLPEEAEAMRIIAERRHRGTGTDPAGSTDTTAAE